MQILFSVICGILTGSGKIFWEKFQMIEDEECRLLEKLHNTFPAVLQTVCTKKNRMKSVRKKLAQDEHTSLMLKAQRTTGLYTETK